MVTQTVFTLGPAGTFSDQAAQRLAGSIAADGGPRPSVVHTKTIAEAVARAAIDPSSVAVAPIENSDTGTVVLTQDLLLRHAVQIEREICVRVRLDLIATGELAAVRRLYAHPVAHGQCSRFVDRELPGVEVIFTDSNTDSADRLLSDNLNAAGAVVPAGFSVGLSSRRVAEQIENDPQNTTRFIVIRAGGVGRRHDFSRAKTSLAIDPRIDRPGLLCDILSVFSRNGINLTRIESRPSRTKPWTYVFLLDVNNNARMVRAWDEISRESWHVSLLGTYDVLE